jgi:hypothetical protein
MKIPRRLNSGQIAVVVTLVITTLLGAMALGADVAVLYFNWAQLQKATDAAVLAGANYLPGNPSQAQTVAQNYANTNGIRSGEIVSTTFSPDNMRMTMLVSRTVPYAFARVLGLSSGLVKVAATAGISTDTEGARGLIPVGLPCTAAQVSSGCGLSAGQTYTLVQAGANGKGASWNVGPGNWGRLGLGSHGADQFFQNLEEGYQGSINVGDAIDAEQGQVNGPTDQGISDRVNLGQIVDPNPTNITMSSVQSAPLAYDPRLVVVPLVDFTGATGNSATVTVTGFAMMWLNSYQSQGSQKGINATFLGIISPGQIQSTTFTFGSIIPILFG